MADSPGVARLLDRYPGARQMPLISFPFGRVMRFMRVGQETRLLLIQAHRDKVEVNRSTPLLDKQ
jgi:hypothetical protein